MNPAEQVDAAIEALQSVKLYRRWYGSTEKTANHTQEMAGMLEGTGDRFLADFAKALRSLA